MKMVSQFEGKTWYGDKDVEFSFKVTVVRWGFFKVNLLEIKDPHMNIWDIVGFPPQGYNDDPVPPLTIEKVEALVNGDKAPGVNVACFPNGMECRQLGFQIPKPLEGQECWPFTFEVKGVYSILYPQRPEGKGWQRR